MSWTKFEEQAPPSDSLLVYRVKTVDGKTGTAIYGANCGFYNIKVDGVELPTGTVITDWDYIQN